jgi:hypothetical protein
MGRVGAPGQVRTVSAAEDGRVRRAFPCCLLAAYLQLDGPRIAEGGHHPHPARLFAAQAAAAPGHVATLVPSLALAAPACGEVLELGPAGHTRGKVPQREQHHGRRHRCLRARSCHRQHPVGLRARGGASAPAAPAASAASAASTARQSPPLALRQPERPAAAALQRVCR